MELKLAVGQIAGRCKSSGYKFFQQIQNNSLTTPIVDMDAIVCHWGHSSVHWTISNMHIALQTINSTGYLDKVCPEN